MHGLAYAGDGKQLRKVTGATGNVVAIDALGRTIYAVPADGYSEIISGGGDNREMLFNFMFADPTTDPPSTGAGGGDAPFDDAVGSIIVQKCPDSRAAGTSETYDTITITTQSQAEWHSGEPLWGHYRIKNSTDKSVFVYANKIVS